MGKADGGFELTAKPGTANIVGPDFPATEVWGFNGDVPGTPIRISHGQPIDATIQNSRALARHTATQCHGRCRWTNSASHPTR